MSIQGAFLRELIMDLAIAVDRGQSCATELVIRAAEDGRMADWLRDSLADQNLSSIGELAKPEIATFVNENFESMRRCYPAEGTGITRNGFLLLINWIVISLRGHAE